MHLIGRYKNNRKLSSVWRICFYLIQELRSKYLHLSNKCARIVMPSARLLHPVIDLPFVFRHKLIASLKWVSSPAPSESLPYWFQGNFAAMFVLNYWLREFLLYAFANRFELRCEPKQQMLFYYKFCRFSLNMRQIPFVPLLTKRVNYFYRQK